MKLIYKILILFFPILLSAQESQYPYKSYSVKNGFITDNIYSVFIDSKGMMWYGTDNGILQYDGTEFKSFTTQDGLPDNEVFNFCEDYYGRIWFATFNGSMGYYFQGKFYNSDNTPTLRDKEHLTYISLIEKQVDSTLIILFSESKVIIEVSKDKIVKREFEYDVELYGSLIYIVKINSNNYVGYTNKAKLYFNQSNLIKIDSTKKILGMYYSKKIFNRQSDSLFVLENGDLKFYRQIQNNLPNPNNYFIDKDGLLFESTRAGIFIYEANKIIPIHRLLPECMVSSINQDIDGNYWISTLNKGIFFFPKGFLNLKYQKYSDLERINTIGANKGRVFLFTDSNKVYKLDKNLKAISYFDFGKYDNVLSRPVKLPIYIDSNSLIIGGNIILKLDLNKPDVLPNLVSNFTPRYSKKILTANGSVYWNARIMLGKSTMVSNKEILKKYRPGDHQRIFDIATNSDEIWVSTLKNIYRLGSDSLVQSSTLNDYSFKVFNFYNGILVGITHEYKLIVGHPLGGHDNFKIQQINQNCAWINMNYIYHNHVLLRSDKGYFILNIGSDSAYLTPSENVLLPDFPQDIACDSPFVYFLGTDNAITKIDNSIILSVPKPPKVIITTFIANNKYCDFESKIYLPKSEAENIQIDFTGIAFNRKKINYQYSVNDKAWINIQENRINLINPVSGEYRIRIRCRSDSSDFSEPIVLEFEILIPWYNSFIFLLFLGFIIIGCTIFVVRIVNKRRQHVEKLKHDEKIKFIQSEFKSLNALMNPHFIFNCLNNIQYLINDDKKLAANQYLGIFSKLIRQNMENISNDLISLEKEMMLIENYLLLEKLRFEDKFDFKIILDPIVDTAIIQVPPLLIQPLVENSIKHGIFQSEQSKGFILVSISKSEDKIVITIEDNGVGLDDHSDNKGLSYSLENIKKRIVQLEEIHGISIDLKIETIRDSKGLVKGTQAMVSILS
ncbi:MAG: histidine kinase [Saprospiraceae bacterium]